MKGWSFGVIFRSLFLFFFAFSSIILGVSSFMGAALLSFFSARASIVRFYTTHAEAGEPAFNVMMMTSRRQQLVLGSARDGHLVGTCDNLWMGSAFGMYGGYHGDGVCGFEEFFGRVALGEPSLSWGWEMKGRLGWHSDTGASLKRTR